MNRRADGSTFSKIIIHYQRPGFLNLKQPPRSIRLEITFPAEFNCPRTQDYIPPLKTRGDVNLRYSGRDVSKEKLTHLKSGSVGAIIGQFKSKCTKRIRQEVNESFEWQDRFYDRIIRDEMEMDNTRAYISNNPVYWKKDKFYL